MPVQARIELSASLRAIIEPYRHRWNPEKSLGNPAHVTVIYHDEASSLVLLRERLAATTPQFRSFELAVGEPRRFQAPALGAFLEVVDSSGSLSCLRTQVLSEPFRVRSRFRPHVTLLHPAQGHRLREAWFELSQISAPGSMHVNEILLVGASNDVLDRFPLAAA